MNAHILLLPVLMDNTMTKRKVIPMSTVSLVLISAQSVKLQILALAVLTILEYDPVMEDSVSVMLQDI